MMKMTTLPVLFGHLGRPGGFAIFLVLIALLIVAAWPARSEKK